MASLMGVGECPSVAALFIFYSASFCEMDCTRATTLLIPAAMLTHTPEPVLLLQNVPVCQNGCIFVCLYVVIFH